MQPSAKGIIKDLLGDALAGTGLWARRLRAWAARRETIILVYHRVLRQWEWGLDYSQPGMVVTAETFERQIQFLRRHFEIVSLDSMSADADMRESGGWPRCVITFDDGWRDNYEVAFPILRKHMIPATIFLTTNFVGTDRTFWHTDLMYLTLHHDLSQLLKNTRVVSAYPDPVRRRLLELPRLRVRDVHAADRLIEAVKATCAEHVRERLIQDIGDTVGCRRPFLRERRFFLDWDQVREMAATGVEIGSHGCSHQILTQLEPKEAEEELVRSKMEIERRTGRAVEHFAFPEGMANAEALSMARRAGYRSASVCELDVGDRQADAFALRRLGMHEGASSCADGSFGERPLMFWLSRGPRVKPPAH